MPRPKRTKVAPSAPAPRVRNVQRNSASASAVAQAQKAPFIDVHDVSDPEDRVVRLVKKNNGKGKAREGLRGRARNEKSPAAMTMTQNGVEREDLLDANGVASPTRSEPGDFLDDIEQGSYSSEVEIGRRVSSTPAVGNSSLGFGNFRRRTRQPSILGRGPGRARSSSVESNIAEDNGLTSVGRTNTSALVAGNFRRRARQNSILGRDTAALPPSSMGLDMTTPAQVGPALKLGKFKRRARASSILGTAQKNPQQRSEYEDDEDVFTPEGESTPLNLSGTRNVTSSSSAKSSNPRKRKLSVAQAPPSPVHRSSDAEDEEERIPATGSVIDDEENQEPPSSSHEPMSETMAPPLGSSSVASSPEPHLPTRPVSRGRRPLRGRTPPLATQDSPVSSPPSLTHSPNRPYMTGRIKKTERIPQSTFSTAQLQALLPRRRRQTTRDPFDIPSSEDEADGTGLASDEDELSQMNIRGRNRRSVFARTPAPSKRNAKGKSVPKTVAKRNYGTRPNATSDKENEEIDPDDSLAPLPDVDGSPENSQELEERVGRELKKAARKFEEVDKWVLDFEDDTGSSSPKDAR